MKMKAKMLMLALSLGAFAMQFNNCARFIGDILGDALWLRGID